MTQISSLPAAPSLRDLVRSAVIWRSGSQILGQIITWASTFLVIRILSPSDYGLYAMTAVVLGLLSLMNGYGFANALIQRREVSPMLLRQVLGMLLALNFALAAIQFAAAPLVAAYYGQPIVADLLRVQALIYLTNPFQALGYAVLSRQMDFRRQAQVNVASGVLAAAAALLGALGGLGIWTLVLAPLVGFGSRALGTTLAARTFILPSFDLRGTRELAHYGGVMTLGQFLWFLQTQTDIAVAGRVFDPHTLGIYTTSLFLTQLFVNKFVPPLNEIAFSAYARVQGDDTAVANGFLKSLRIVWLAGVPFSLGLAAAAEPAVIVLMGEKWLQTVPVIVILGFAMPFMTLQVLFGPAMNALGRPGIYARLSLVGAVLLPAAFLVGVQFGAIGMAFAWLVGYPVLIAISAIWVLPAVRVSLRECIAALAPPTLAGLAMFLAVSVLDTQLSGIDPLVRLTALVLAGAAVYGLWLLAFSRDRLTEIADLVRRGR